VNTVLFGVDLTVLIVGLMKLIEDFVEVPAKLSRLIHALLTAGVVVLVGLQQQGVILGPETESYVVLGLTALSAFLGAMGYLDEAASLLRAGSDLVRLKAFGMAGKVVMAESDSTRFQRRVDRLMARYNVSKLVK